MMCWTPRRILPAGQTAGKDADANKPTYVGLLGLDGAQAEAERLLAQALTALQSLQVSPERVQALQGIAERIVRRDH